MVHHARVYVKILSEGMMHVFRVLEQLGGRRVAYMGPLPHTQSSESRPRRPFVECVCVCVCVFGCGWGPTPIVRGW